MNSRVRFNKREILISLALESLVVLCFGQTPKNMSPWFLAERGGQNLDPHLASSNALFSAGQFYHIPGPNPILVRGGNEAWDERTIESCDIIKNFGTYYYYYHALPLDAHRWKPAGWRIGVATAAHPLGPWTKYKGNPIVVQGAPGSWDDQGVFSATVLRHGPNQFYMFFGGSGSTHKCCHIGFATAKTPLGPWRTYPGNPVLKDFGYPASILYHAGKFYLYAEYPIGSTAPDYGPLAVATAKSPEGPWTKWAGNPVLKAGDWGSWDDGGFSESKVFFWQGVFNVFYGGAKRYNPRSLTRESIGYAYSFDGFHFIKYTRNPVALREDDPNAAAFAEDHALVEPPFVYVFHTLRYVFSKNPRFPGIEDLGVEALAFRRRFRLRMPLFSVHLLANGHASSLEICPPIGMGDASGVALTVRCNYSTAAQSALQVHVKSSPYGVHYDTADLYSFSLDVNPGQMCQKTVNLSPKASFLKVIVENPDPSHPVSNIVVTATVIGS